MNSKAREAADEIDACLARVLSAPEYLKAPGISELATIISRHFPPTEAAQVVVEAPTYAHMCCDGHHEIGFNDPDDEYSERCPLCSEVDRLVDGVRDHLISLGVPDSRIDGAGCDSGDPLDFTTAEITQAFSYIEDHNVEKLTTARADAIRECVNEARAVADTFAPLGIARKAVDEMIARMESLTKKEGDDGSSDNTTAS